MMLEDAMQYSSASPPLEVQLAEMFSGGGILRDARLGGMHVGRLMAKVAASFESLKEHQADEIAALKRGFQLEIEKLFANIPADKREAREGVVIVAPDALYDETQTSHEGSDPSPCSEESSEQAITASGTETLLLLNNDIRESDPVLLAEGPMTSPDPHSKQLKMHDSLSPPSFPPPLAGTCKRAWDSMEAHQRTHGSLCHVDQPPTEALPAWGQGPMAPDSVLLPASFSERSGMSSEWGSEGRDTDGSTGEAGSEWGPRSEAADRESEWLNLALQPEGRIDDSEDAPWRKEAAEAKRRFEDSITQSGASEQTAKVTLPSTSRKHARAHGTEALGFPPPPPTPSPLKAPVVSHSTAHPPTAKRFRRSQSPFCPHSPPPEHTLPPATAAPPFPSVKRARTKRPVAAVQDAVLALPCPLPAPASTQPLPPQVPQPPVFPGRGQPLTSLGVPASPRLLAPASLSPSALLADDTVRKYEVFCKPKTGMEGANLEGTLCVMRSKRAIVICTCRDCLETHGPAGRGLSPVEFEAHAGRLHHKKWRQSLWVRLPAAGGPRETTVEQCRALQGGKHLVSVPTAPDAPPVKTSSQAPGRRQHSGDFAVSRCSGTRNSAIAFHKMENESSKE